MKHNQLEILVTDRESIEKGFLVRTPYVLISMAIGMQSEAG